MPFLKPDHSPLIKHPSGHPVAVIAAFNTVGDLIPRYFSVEDGTCEIFKFKVEAVKSIKDQHMVKIFYCSYEVHGCLNYVSLCFDIMECRWMIG